MESTYPVLARDEHLFRAVEPIAMTWDFAHNRPTSGAFKSSKGMSTDRAMMREKQECVLHLSSSKRGNIVAFLVDHCWKEEMFVKPDPVEAEPDHKPEPIEANPFHVLVQRSQSELELTRQQARWLATVSTIEFYAMIASR